MILSDRYIEMVIANPLSWELEMRGWSFPIHFVGNKKLGLSERSSDVAGTFTQGQLPHFFPLVSDECGCPTFSTQSTFVGPSIRRTKFFRIFENAGFQPHRWIGTEHKYIMQQDHDTLCVCVCACAHVRICVCVCLSARVFV